MPRGLSWVSGELDEVLAGPKNYLERQVRSDDSPLVASHCLQQKPKFLGVLPRPLTTGCVQYSTLLPHLPSNFREILEGGNPLTCCSSAWNVLPTFAAELAALLCTSPSGTRIRPLLLEDSGSGARKTYSTSGQQARSPVLLR